MGDPLEDPSDENNATAQPDTGAGRKRDRTAIEFPYADLERSVDMANILLREGGQAQIEQTQLAVAMDQSATGGTFRSRLGAARMFGLVITEQGKVQLTPLGLRITDNQTAPAARAEAFLNIALYRAMFDRYQGYALPPAAAIERQMESLGVPPKQKERARQAFSASAQHAGYIASNGRFSKPTFAGARVKEEALDDVVHGGGGGSGGGGGGGNGGGDDGKDGGKGNREDAPGLHPFILGLLKTLPDPGAQWDAPQRANWLNTAASIFTLIYKGDGTVTVAVQKE